MVKLLIGTKGSGKTKRLIDEVNKALATTKGNVVCIEKNKVLSYNVNYQARLVTTDDYGISGYPMLYGLLCGLCSGNHDITDVLVDATLRIGSRDPQETAAFLKRVSELSTMAETDFVFTLSINEEELPAEVFEFCKKI
ncbi:MAG: hypothetical protein IJL26_10635 [Clostridia bacterium]|nr:hypothetical protein [Clostridia bacterium]